MDLFNRVYHEHIVVGLFFSPHLKIFLPFWKIPSCVEIKDVKEASMVKFNGE